MNQEDNETSLIPNHMVVWILNHREMHYCFKLIPVFHINEIIHEHMEEWR